MILKAWLLSVKAIAQVGSQIGGNQQLQALLTSLSSWRDFFISTTSMFHTQLFTRRSLTEGKYKKTITYGCPNEEFRFYPFLQVSGVSDLARQSVSLVICTLVYHGLYRHVMDTCTIGKFGGADHCI